MTRLVNDYEQMRSMAESPPAEHDALVVQVAGLDEDAKRRWLVLYDDLYRSCGCTSGAIAFLAAASAGLAVVWATYDPQTGIDGWLVGGLVLLTLAASVVAKFVGMKRPHIRFRRYTHALIARQNGDQRYGPTGY